MFAKYQNEIIKQMQKVISYPSVLVQPVVSGPFGKSNKECLEYVLSLCSSLGFKTKNLDGFCGYAEVGDGKEIFGIIVHLDVVPEGKGWDYPPYEGKIVENRLYGRGVWDDKGPAITVIYALKALMDEGYKFEKRIRIIFGCNEESGSLCIEHYLKVEGQIDYGFSPDGDFPVIFGEKTISTFSLKGIDEVNNSSIKLIAFNGGEVPNAVIGEVDFTLQTKTPKENILKTLSDYLITRGLSINLEEQQNDLLTFKVIGKAAHGSTPQFGINAASYAICALKQLDIKSEFIDWYEKYINCEYNGKSLNIYAHDEYGDLVVNVGVVRYNKGEYELLINCRLPFTTSTQKLYDGMTLTLKDFCKITTLTDSQGFIFDKNHPMVKIMIKNYQAITNDKESLPLCIGGGTYAREFNNCVAFGPSFPFSPVENMHGANERMDLNLLKPLFEIYYQTIKDLVLNYSSKK